MVLKVVHRALIGTTGSGKTTKALKDAGRYARCLIINPKDDNIKGFVKVTGHSIGGWGDLRRLLEKGVRVNYVPDANVKIAFKELDLIVAGLFKMGNVLIIFDEAEKYGYQGLTHSALIDVAERGRSKGVEGWFLIQDPANVSKTILRMCDDKFYFRFDEYAAKYLRAVGYDVEAIRGKLQQKGEFSYIWYNRGIEQGVYKDKKGGG